MSADLHEPVGPVRVALVDDHPMFRAGVAERLAHAPVPIEVVAECGGVRDALTRLPVVAPDLVLMDVSMADGNGIDATRRLRVLLPDTAVVILSIYDDVQYLEAALAAGAAGYLIKTIDANELATAIVKVLAGELVVSPVLAEAALRRGAQSVTYAVPHEPLSAREHDVLTLLARGRSNKEIARSLDLSVRTVETHLRSIFTKLGVTSRTEAVITAVREGVVDFDADNKSLDDRQSRTATAPPGSTVLDRASARGGPLRDPHRG